MIGFRLGAIWVVVGMQRPLNVLHCRDVIDDDTTRRLLNLGSLKVILPGGTLRHLDDVVHDAVQIVCWVGWSQHVLDVFVQLPAIGTLYLLMMGHQSFSN